MWLWPQTKSGEMCGETEIDFVTNSAIMISHDPDECSLIKALLIPEWEGQLRARTVFVEGTVELYTNHYSTRCTIQFDNNLCQICPGADVFVDPHRL